MSTMGYQQLETLPEPFIGELFDGQIHAQPRPTAPHGYTHSLMGVALGNPFHNGVGGFGGWWIIDGPEVHLLLDRDVTVPDFAGWRRERMPKFLTSHKFEIVPDWICKILSPSTRSIDREIKMPLYARYGVSWLWLVEPIEHILEALRLEAKTRLEIDRYTGTAQADIPLFDAVPFNLGCLWVPTGV